MNNNYKLDKNHVWFFDLDDTLVSTMDVHKKACSGVGDTLKNYFEESISKEAESLFCHYFTLMFEAYHIRSNDEWKNISASKEEYEDLMSKVKYEQKNVIKEFGYIKKWSREVLIRIALESVLNKYHISIDIIRSNPNIIYKSANAYWDITVKEMHIFKDALELLKFLHINNKPIFITTSSDGRLLINENGEFYYDPTHSEKLKRARIEKMRNKGLIYNEIIIGDPEDKPSIEYFEKGIIIAQQVLQNKISSENCIMVGDSYEGDLKIPREKLNFKLVVLINRISHKSEFIKSNYLECHTLKDLIY